ncbi:integumentary mucin C.1 [Xyrichtys novacula]|nr:integumentary mucin C.1 [Xyrichtys novacula]
MTATSTTTATPTKSTMMTTNSQTTPTNSKTTPTNSRMTPTNSKMTPTNSKMTPTAGSPTASTNKPPASPTSATSAASKMTMAQTTPKTMVSGGTSASNSMTSGSGSTNSMMSSTQPTNSTGMSGMSGTSMYTSMGMISCPSFACNYSDCYSMYMSQNATSCTPGACCELIRQTSMYYTAGCTNTCSDPCINGSQTNCSVSCCNSTGCLNSSFASMMMTTATAAMSTTKKTTTIKPTTTTTMAIPQTTAKKGKMCHQGQCTGTDCYKNFNTMQTCSSTHLHCQLKKETAGTSFKWTAGCFTNCSTETPCKTATKPPCCLECCVATMTSCLRLNGTLNVLNVATRGPHLNTELIASLLCLLALTLLR